MRAQGAADRLDTQGQEKGRRGEHRKDLQAATQEPLWLNKNRSYGGTDQSA